MDAITAAPPPLPVTDSRRIAFFSEPFPHFVCPEFFDAATADALLAWLEAQPWRSVGLDGYDGYCDMPLTASNLPETLSGLVAPGFLNQLRQILAQFFAIDSNGYVRATAHRILTGGFLSAHTDVSYNRFTHRLNVQLNRGWNPDCGGLLCLHAGDPHSSQETLHKTVPPTHRSGFAFEVSERSYHSVTPILHGQRYTLSYTFYPPANGERGAAS
ncbi:MAG: 2OG-Fe(II) oxygenase [Terracidiphilus sp.]|jgi:hypothetical protein